MRLLLRLLSVIPSCEIVTIYVYFPSFHHVRLLQYSLPLIPSCEIFTMFSSDHFVMWDCYDVLFRSFRHLRLLWCSFPVISSLSLLRWSLSVISSLQIVMTFIFGHLVIEIVMMFVSVHFITWDFYDIHFRSLRWQSSLNFLQSLHCKINRMLQHTNCVVYRLVQCTLRECIASGSSGSILTWQVLHLLI